MESTQRHMAKQFDKIGKNCPFLLAQHLGVKIGHRGDLGDIYGWYRTSSPETLRIFINTSLDIETQEQICYELVAHHLGNVGVELCLTAEAYAGLVSSRSGFARIKRLLKDKRTALFLPNIVN